LFGHFALAWYDIKNELLFKVLSLVPHATTQPLRPTLERKIRGGLVRVVRVGSCQVWLVGVSLYGACRNSR